MTKTGKQWYEEAEVLRKEGKVDEAMVKYKESIAAFQKMSALDENDFYTLQGMAEKLIYNLPKREEALIVLELCDKCQVSDKALYAGVNLNRGNAYLALDKIDKAREAFIASVEGGSKYPESYAMAGSLSEDIGNFDAALKYFDQGLKINSKDYKSNLLKGNFLLARGKPKEAKTYYLDILSRQPNDALTNYKLASIHTAEGNKDAAKKCYEMGAAMNPNTSASWAAKGQCLSMLGKSDEAMEKFKTAQNILETNKTAISAPWFVNNTKAALKAVLEAEETAKKVQAEVAQLDQSNPAVKKFTVNMKQLQEKKVAAQNKALDDAGKKEHAGKDHHLSDLDKIKEEFQKQLEALKKEMSEFKKEVRTDITNLKNNMQEMKEEIASKMDDFSRKLDIELNKQDLTDEDKQKLKSYFKAFIGTISSAHVTAQVVDSGMVQLDSDSSAATVLSFMASFAPFVGSALQTGIKSIGDFLQTKEMKSNARILKGLAPDAVGLSQIIGKTGFGILMDKKKQEEILTTTDQEMNKLTGNSFQKIFEFCRQVSEKIDVFLYTQLYKTAPERIANADANELIDLWTKGKVMPFGIEDQFINHILNGPKGGKEEVSNNAAGKETRSACCNLF